MEAADAHPLQAFFGMPRRIRLLFEDNAEQRPCALTGAVDARIVTALVRKGHGIDYGVWPHPLTPYFETKSGEIRAARAESSFVGYREWVGCLFAGERRRVAHVLVVAKRRLKPGRREILAGGYITKRWKVLDYAEADLPLYVMTDEAAQQALEKLAYEAVAAAEVAAQTLRWALRHAIGAEKSDVLPIDTPVRAFWATTEQPFRDLLSRTFEMASDSEADMDARDAARSEWCKVVGDRALAAFDRALPPDSLWQRHSNERDRIVRARATLVGAFRHGYGKFGAALFTAMGLAPPHKVKKREAEHG